MTNAAGKFCRLSSDLVCTYGLSEFYFLLLLIHKQAHPKDSPILKLTDCEDVKSNIISVLIINLETITGFASIHLLLFVCLYLHSKTCCCIKYGYKDVNKCQCARVSVHMFSS